MSQTRFVYHASAVGLSARFTRPFQETLDSQAPSALTASGGYSSAQRENIRVRGFLSCARVRTETAGSYTPAGDSHNTFAAATAEGFNLGDIVRAERITAYISSAHPASGDIEPSITPLGSGFTKLSVAGQELELHSFVPDFTRLDTMTKLRDAYRNDAEFRQNMDAATMIGQQDQIADERLHKFFPWCGIQPTGELPEYRNATILPLFRILNRSSPGFTVLGNLISVANFGRIHVGEVIITSYERRLTGLHFELGSPVDGDGDVCFVGGNGSNTNDPP